MRNRFMQISLIFISLAVVSSWAVGASNHSVKGYVKRNGIYVAPHKQTNPNRTQRDNWSAKGNANPYTGKSGRKEPRK